MTIRERLAGIKFSRQQQFLMGAVIVVIALAGTGGFLYWHSQQYDGPIPKRIAQKASFSIFYPAPNQTGVSPVASSLSYSDSSDGLSYMTYVGTKQVFVSEQTTPDVFSQSGVYDYKLNQSHQYDSFNTTAGEVTLTNPTELGGQTLAWDNAKGTLLLARATKTLTETEWKNLFNNMIITN